MTFLARWFEDNSYQIEGFRKQHVVRRTNTSQSAPSTKDMVSVLAEKPSYRGAIAIYAPSMNCGVYLIREPLTDIGSLGANAKRRLSWCDADPVIKKAR